MLAKLKAIQKTLNILVYFAISYSQLAINKLESIRYPIRRIKWTTMMTSLNDELIEESIYEMGRRTITE